MQVSSVASYRCGCQIISLKSHHNQNCLFNKGNYSLFVVVSNHFYVFFLFEKVHNFPYLNLSLFFVSSIDASHAISQRVFVDFERQLNDLLFF